MVAGPIKARPSPSGCVPVVRVVRHGTNTVASARRGPPLLIASNRLGAVRVPRRNHTVIACPYSVEVS